jgi:beta-mannosidase
VIQNLQSFQLSSSPPGSPCPTDASAWIDAVVPGGVHESLLAAGLIGHPFYGDNEAAVAWVEDRTWWYRCCFPAPAAASETDRILLHFACIDTVADVQLNGVPLGAVRNQHRPHSFDVTHLIAPENELFLMFPPPLSGLLSEEAADVAIEGIRARQHAVRPGADELPREALLLPVLRGRLRKATFSWGWDFAARVPSLGLAGGVHLEMGPPVRLGELHVRTDSLDIEAGLATLAVAVRAEGGDRVRVDVHGPDGSRVQVEVPAADDVRVAVDLTDVLVWWTHDLGSQPLYDVAVTLLAGGTGVATCNARIGIRTIELDRSPDPQEPGRHFRFVLNGVPIFARGANWVPASLLVGSIPASTYAELVALAVLANMTMLRVWGGGVYEADAFYDACDAAGVLVWQDFMFACFDYPTDGTDLVEQVRGEAAHQLTRLRNHASLALWCGNNEVQAIHQITNGSLEGNDWGSALFHEVLPSVVAEHHPGAAYWPGSPWGDATTEMVNGVTDGDRHAWEVWHGQDVGAGGPTAFASRGEAVHFHRFDHDYGRFISEFGIHASPELATLQRWTPPGSLSLGAAAFDQRQKDTPKDKGFALMEYETGLPATIEEYVDFSMACQAEGLKHGVEHYRRRQPQCSGTLVWQFNDCWPGLSWSVIDYDLVPKAGYYFLQRGYQPLTASFTTTHAGLELWVTNSGMASVELELTVEIGRVAGGDARQHGVRVTTAPYSSVPVWTQTDVPGPEWYAWISERQGLLPSNRRFFGRLKDVLGRGTAVLEATLLDRDQDRAEVQLIARGYTYLSRITSDLPGARFSTNYIDLRDGDACLVEVTGLVPGARLSAAHFGGPVLPVA